MMLTVEGANMNLALGATTMKRLGFSRNRIMAEEKGFTLVEIIIVLVILAIAVVPIIQAYGPALLSTDFEEQTAVFNNQARRTLTRIAALSFDTLNINQGNPVNLPILFGSAEFPKPEEAAKETFTLKGKSYTPIVAITDVSGGLGGLVQLSVTIEQVQFTTLRASDS